MAETTTTTEAAAEQPLEAKMLEELITSCLNSLEDEDWFASKQVIFSKLKNNETGEAVKCFIKLFEMISRNTYRVRELSRKYTLLRHISSVIKDLAIHSNGFCFNVRHTQAISDLRAIIETFGNMNLTDFRTAQRIDLLDEIWDTSFFELYTDQIKDLKDA